MLNIRRQEEAIENAEDDWVHDSRNPRNWTFGKKWRMAGIVRFSLCTVVGPSPTRPSQVSLYTFVSPLASSMMAPGLPEIAEHFNIHSETIIAMTLSIFLITFAIGPLFLAPLSEIYGRTWVRPRCSHASVVLIIFPDIAPRQFAIPRFQPGLRFLTEHHDAYHHAFVV